MPPVARPLEAQVAAASHGARPAIIQALLATAAMPQCYLDPSWPSSSIRVLSNITFGSSFNNKTGMQETLQLDAYLPPESDVRTAVPVAVVVHGGGFTDGDKTWEGDVQLAMALASRGFAAVSVNYRLTGDYWPWDVAERQILDAVEDVRAAVRYVRSVATTHQLDTDRILLAGGSAPESNPHPARHVSA
mgnify:CR=1 FL=1